MKTVSTRYRGCGVIRFAFWMVGLFVPLFLLALHADSLPQWFVESSWAPPVLGVLLAVSLIAVYEAVFLAHEHDRGAA